MASDIERLPVPLATSLPDDERHLRVELTDQGRALREAVGAARAQIVCALGGDEAPIQRLKRDLHQVTGRLRGATTKE